MRPLSHQVLAMIPAGLAVVLVLLAATPLDAAGLTYTPNIAWLMTLVMVAFYPPSWPRGFAFFLGLAQDILFMTPLGSQALLALMLAQFTAAQGDRQQSLFRLRWLEAAGVLVVMHLMLWVIMQAVGADSASLRHLLRAGLVNALWYPLFYWLATRAFAPLPDAK